VRRGAFQAGERGLVCGPAREDDEAATAGGAGGAERDRLRGPADRDPGADAAPELDLVVEELRTLPSGSGGV
jgi:hypothetical protein